jgi:sterol desaturase/sphingolipid hydroxylase (fatty acid hydroxylase superfamily)
MYPEAAAFHDYHHTVNKGNFGYLITDWLFGTMDDYVQMGMADGYLAKMKKDQLNANSKDE